jgi:GTP-binding protein HflX
LIYNSAILVTYPYEDSINEAIELSKAAEYNIIKIVTQKEITKSKFGIGAGKAKELQEFVENLNPGVIIFDEVIKPSQQYNLATLCKREVIDRERLILEIFEKRSKTSESNIQIKLAQLRYEMVRAKEKVRLAKKGEQPGFFGLGKYDADVYILDIKRRVAVLKKKLENEKKRKDLFRNQRTKTGLPIVAVAGYTSAGKTTVFNFFSGETKQESKELFTTLTTYTRSIVALEEKILISDTVGFISKLPPYLIDAFKSTLREMSLSDLVLLVTDISEPSRIIKGKMNSCSKILAELQVPESKIVYIFNKIDKINLEEAQQKLNDIKFPYETTHLFVSARDGFNMEALRQIILSKTTENIR